MNNVRNFLETLGGIETEDRVPRALEITAFVFLALMILFAPHSIAATQTAWLIGMTAWIIRMFIKPRPTLTLTGVGVSLAALFAWSVVSSILSYEPAISLDKLRGASTFLIFIYAINVIKNRRAVIILAIALISSCMISALSAPIQKLMGRGVEVSGLTAEGTLARLGVVDGDTIVRVDGHKISDPEAVIEALDNASAVRLTLYRPDYEFQIDLSRPSLNTAQDPAASLGFSSWKPGRKFRAAGFYGHYTTFAEVLQLIGALAFGLFVSAFTWRAGLRPIVALALSLGAVALALLFTVTRASQLAFIISSTSTLVLGASRKFILIAAVIAIPIAAGGLMYLQRERQVGFFDSKDGSIQWRQMMWRDGYRLLKESPRHLLVGVGMDSVKARWEEWGFFDKGWQPMGHFHSTPLQLAVERGIPALMIWLIVLGLYGRMLWHGLRRSKGTSDWRSRGILLGCLGSLVGFFVSGLVHYNLGDQEVAMVFFILMALGVKLAQLPPPDELLIANSPILASRADVV